MIIYCTENKINGKRYIGQHKHCSSNEEFQNSGYWGSGLIINNAIQKYGIQNFRKWVLLHCEKSEANHYEKLWIRKLETRDRNKGYNIAYGGRGASGIKWSIESKIKLSKTLRSKEGRAKYQKTISSRSEEQKKVISCNISTSQLKSRKKQGDEIISKLRQTLANTPKEKLQERYRKIGNNLLLFPIFRF